MESSSTVEKVSASKLSNLLSSNTRKQSKLKMRRSKPSMRRKGWQLKPKIKATVKSRPLYPLSKKNQKERVAAAVVAKRFMSLIMKDRISHKKHHSLRRRLKKTKLPSNKPV